MYNKLMNKFNIFSNTQLELLHTTDLHSHLIPGIDDGVDTLDESIEIIKKIKDMGFKKIITTPHIMQHRFPNNWAEILEGYQLLKHELGRLEIDVQLEVAAEYYFDEYFLDYINKKELLTFGDNYVLFEFSFQIKPFGVEQVVSRIFDLGYKPVLAHPERYIYYNKPEDYLALKELGILFQINAVSTQGFYGKKAKKSAEEIINLGIVDFIGSDTHSMKYIESFHKTLQSNIYPKIFEKNTIRNDFL